MKYIIGKAVFTPVRGTSVKLWKWWPVGSRSSVVIDENQLYLLGGRPEKCDKRQSRTCVKDGLKYLSDQTCPCFIIYNKEWAENKQLYSKKWYQFWK